SFLVGGPHRAVVVRLIDLNRLTIEVWISEVVRGATKVHEREVVLAGVLVHSRPTPEDLLELGHRANRAVEDDQATRLDIDTSGKKTRCRHECRESCFRINEVAELILALSVISGDTHHVPPVLG